MKKIMYLKKLFTDQTRFVHISSFCLFIALFNIVCCQIIYAAQWRNADTAFIDGDAVLFNDVDTNLTDYVVNPLDRMLSGYQMGMALGYSSASQITVSAGEAMVSNSAGTIRLMLRNTSSTTVSFSDIDTGAEASSTTYYVYAIAATAASETATFKVSASSTAPSGVTYYAKLGSFYNDGSSNIDMSKIYAEPYGSAPTSSSGLAFGQMGDWVTKSWDTTYQALTDGFVVCYAAVDNGDDFSIVTDSSSSPSTVRQSIGTGSGTTGFAGVMSSPVKKGDYYRCKINSGSVGTSAMYFLPMGY